MTWAVLVPIALMSYVEHMLEGSIQFSTLLSNIHFMYILVTAAFILGLTLFWILWLHIDKIFLSWILTCTIGLLYYRYEEKNVKAASFSKPYDKDVPFFLRDRPKRFIAHCMQRMPPNVTAIPAESVRQIGPAKAEVDSVDTPGVTYELNFGDDSHRPTCSCKDFRQTQWVCKHFLAVMHHCPELGWEKLSPLFRESRFLCLDLGPTSCSQEQESPETQAQEPSVPESTATTSSPTSHDEESLASKGVQVRQITRFFEGLSYKFVSESNRLSLTDLLKGLTELRTRIEPHGERLKVVFKRARKRAIKVSMHRRKKRLIRNLPFGTWKNIHLLVYTFSSYSHITI